MKSYNHSTMICIHVYGAGTVVPGALLHARVITLLTHQTHMCVSELSGFSRFSWKRVSDQCLCGPKIIITQWSNKCSEKHLHKHIGFMAHHLNPIP